MYANGALPGLAQQRMDRFLRRYGSRGLAEFDAGRPRWIEEPLPVFQVLAGYLSLDSGEQAPDAVFRRGEQRAEEAVQELAAAARRGPRGRRRAKLLLLAAGRARALMGARENPKFFAVRMMGILRLEILDVGRTLVETGVRRTIGRCSAARYRACC